MPTQYPRQSVRGRRHAGHRTSRSGRSGRPKRPQRISAVRCLEATEKGLRAVGRWWWRRSDSSRHAIRSVGAVVALVVGAVGLPTGAAMVAHAGPLRGTESWTHMSDARVLLSVYSIQTGKSQMLPMNDYILQVLSAELTPKSKMAAMEAAAVACRTYAVRADMLHGQGDGLAASHHDDLTDSPETDLPMWSASEVQRAYGNAADLFIARLQTSIERTDGMVVTYHGSPILAFQFPISGGHTVSALQAFGKDIPYLPSVPCPADAASPRHQEIIKVDPAEWDAVFPANPLPKSRAAMSKLVDVRYEGQSGVVREVQVGKEALTASAFAAKLHLPSLAFHVHASAHSLSFLCEGRGLQVGMSLHEANALAEQGETWEAILATFYPGTKDEPDVSFLGSSLPPAIFAR
ncbi:MAG: SpoIID/LytB domain-containing protein [Alicyclobacillaceae bacterium]|nr:SpoIID/LytB domain-containing protein [Alicyclobacillaceae bacterium]